MQSRSSLNYFYLILYYVECFRGRIQALIAQTQATLAVTPSATPWENPWHKQSILLHHQVQIYGSADSWKEKPQYLITLHISTCLAHSVQGSRVHVSKNQVPSKLFLLVTP